MRSWLRIEQLRPGAVSAFLRRMHADWDGLPKQLLVFCTEFGELNRVLLFGDADAPMFDAASTGLRSSAPVLLELQHRHGDLSHDADARLFELRTYTPQSGQLERFLAAMLDAMPTRERYSRPLGIWTTRHDDRDQVLHIWPYRDLQHRDAARAGGGAEESWQHYGTFALGVLDHMTSNILVRPPNWPPQDAAP